MIDPEAVVYVVDDEASVRRALTRLLASAGLRTEAFASAEEFLQAQSPDGPSCLVLDVALPGATGTELQEALIERGNSIPIVFITGHADVPTVVRALRGGAINLLPKPFGDAELLDAVVECLAVSRQRRRRARDAADIRARAARLSRRQRQVMHLVAQGLLNKQIGTALGITEKTVKVHRAKLMQLMQVNSVAELVRALTVLEQQPQTDWGASLTPPPTPATPRPT
ncbi:response regulator [bacterium]|nr:response regulator [bacterium]